MVSEEKAVVPKPPVEAGDRGLQIKSMDDAYRFSDMVVKSGLAPSGMKIPAQVMVAVQTGMELGLTPMRALQSVVVVNGKATLMGEAALALIRGSGKIEPGTDVEVGTVTDPDTGQPRYGICRSRRKGGQWQETRFTVEQAKKAKLWGKSGPWSSYPDRMLMWRAVAWHSRDYWSDVLYGLMLADEAIDVAQATRAPERPQEPTQATRTGESDPLRAEIVVEPDPLSDGSENPSDVYDNPVRDAAKAKNEAAWAKALAPTPDEVVPDEVPICPVCKRTRINPEFQEKCDACLVEEEQGEDPTLL